MIQEYDEYIFSLTNDGIRAVVNFELTDEQCEDIAYEVESWFDGMVAKVAAEYRRKFMSTHQAGWPVVKADVSLQVWSGRKHDYAHEVDTVVYDCTEALNRMPLSELPWDGDFGEGACNFGDDVFYESIELGLVEDWDGPFTFHLAPNTPYEEYLDERVRREYGYEPRED